MAETSRARRALSAVPVIDFQSLTTRDADSEGARTMDRACRGSGFFLLANHGLEPRLQEVWDVTRWFFSRQASQKQAVARSEENSRGYYNRELTKNTRDMKEVFDFGHVPDPARADDDPVNRTQDGWNQWPRCGGSARFRRVLEGYFKHCHAVGLRLLEVMAANLGVPGDDLTKDFSPAHTSFLRLNYYPVADPLGEHGTAAETGHMGVHHHTDAGALTLLLQDDVGGLEIRFDDEWLPVEPRPGTLVVNIGDIVQVWSNDRYRAPLHRVVASTQRDRYSLPYFMNPVYSATYAPLKTLTDESDPPRYSPINWGHFRYERQHGDYGDYGEEIQISDYRIGD